MLIAEFFGLLVVIIGAAWLLSIGAEKLAEKYGANFAGSILLALVTTLPEYLFVFWAAVKSEYQMAIGSAVGACTLLVTLGYGSVILVATSRLSRKPVEVVRLSRNTQIDAVYLFVTAIIAFVLAWIGGGLSVIDGFILTAVFAVYMVHHWDLAGHISATIEHNVTRKDVVRAVLMMAVGGVVILLTAERFVDAMLGIAHWLGISPIAIALVLSPIASELPEKITAYLTIMRDGRLAEISVCNFMGSKVNHNSLLLAVMPFVAAAMGKGQVTDIIGAPFIMMTVLTLIAGASLMRRRLEHWQGWAFILLYLATLIVAYEVRAVPPAH